MAALKQAASTPATLAALRAYAEALVSDSGWPIRLDDILIITSGSGGLELLFSAAGDDAPARGRTAAADDFFALSHEQKLAHWQAIFCGPRIEALMQTHGWFGARVVYGGGIAFSTDAIACLDPEDQESFRRLASVRRALDRWQWELARGNASADEYRETAGEIGLAELWPYVRNDDGFEPAFRDWLEAEVLNP